jgi:hypothetical protein
MISSTCRSLIAESRRFSTTYGAGFFDHLPMALLALERLGGGEARLRQFAAPRSTRNGFARSRPESLYRVMIGAKRLASDAMNPHSPQDSMKICVRTARPRCSTTLFPT